MGLLACVNPVTHALMLRDKFFTTKLTIAKLIFYFFVRYVHIGTTSSSVVHLIKLSDINGIFFPNKV